MIQVTKRDNAQTIISPVAEPRGQGCNIVQLPPPRSPNESARLRQAASHREEFADCIQMALACLLGLVLTLTASALLRDAGMPGEVAHYLQEGLRFLAVASGFTAMLAVCLALVHFIQFRQV
jgi:hypothetical protein